MKRKLFLFVAIIMSLSFVLMSCQRKEDTTVDLEAIFSSANLNAALSSVKVVYTKIDKYTTQNEYHEDVDREETITLTARIEGNNFHLIESYEGFYDESLEDGGEGLNTSTEAYYQRLGVNYHRFSQSTEYREEPYWAKERISGDVYASYTKMFFVIKNIEALDLEKDGSYYSVIPSIQFLTLQAAFGFTGEENNIDIDYLRVKIENDNIAKLETSYTYSNRNYYYSVEYMDFGNVTVTLPTETKFDFDGLEPSILAESMNNVKFVMYDNQLPEYKQYLERSGNIIKRYDYFEETLVYEDYLQKDGLDYFQYKTVDITDDNFDDVTKTKVQRELFVGSIGEISRFLLAYDIYGDLRYSLGGNNLVKTGDYYVLKEEAAADYITNFFAVRDLNDVVLEKWEIERYNIEHLKVTFDDYKIAKFELKITLPDPDNTHIDTSDSSTENPDIIWGEEVTIDLVLEYWDYNNVVLALPLV